MSEERIAALEQDIRNYGGAVRILRDVYLESLGKDDP